MWLAAASLALAAAFIALNYRAYDGFFQDDELDNLSWAPSVPLADFARAFLKPTFDAENFRPTGHLYFALAGRACGLDFPPWITALFVFHLLNVLLLYLVMRKLEIGRWFALAGVAFFALSATAMDAYWKPMYVFDLLCTTLCLTSLLLWMHRRWVLSFVAFWLAYKAKELAVMLPAVLVAYEYWPGRRRFAPLLPFLAVSLSFGLQGILRNPNKDNEYTFRFTLASLATTIPFYAGRVFLVPFGGLALLPLAFTRDRRVWFGLTAMSCFLFTLLFLPGRLYEGYAYLPLTGAAIALAAAASRVPPAWAWIALALWMPWNIHDLRREQRAKLAGDDEAFAFVDQMRGWVRAHPAARTLVFSSAPRIYHDWGITATWNLAHHSLGLPALFRDSRQAVETMRKEAVALAAWDSATRTLRIRIHSPD